DLAGLSERWQPGLPVVLSTAQLWLEHLPGLPQQVPAAGSGSAAWTKAPILGGWSPNSGPTGSGGWRPSSEGSLFTMCCWTGIRRAELVVANCLAKSPTNWVLAASIAVSFAFKPACSPT